MSKIELSVIIPAYNEVESIPALVERLNKALAALGRTSEVLFINDGSSDGTGAFLDKMCAKYADLNYSVLHLRTNCGKSTALQVGFDAARGDIFVMMDADLQDQPEEIVNLLEKLDSGELDAVTGWKVNRKDPVLSKNIPSKYFNKMLKYLSGVEIHDFNCGLKAFRRECVGGIKLYGQMHRFILVLIAHHGFRVGEVGVRHEARQFGKSKYGVRRIYHGFMDLLTIFFITRYLGSPLHFFGFYGVCSMAVAVPLGLFYLSGHFYSILFNHPEWHLSQHPLWITAPVLFLLGLIIIFFGILGELMSYHFMSTRYYEPFVVDKNRSGKGNSPDPDQKIS